MFSIAEIFKTFITEHFAPITSWSGLQGGYTKFEVQL